MPGEGLPASDSAIVHDDDISLPAPDSAEVCEKSNLLLALVFCTVKILQRRRPKEDINDMYGTYDITGEQSDYSTVQDTNDYYG